jgi:predicted TIM-barrel fold metal-dependent hydrolase
MSEPLSEGRPTFTTETPRFPRKIALEEAVNTSVFNATTTNPPVPGATDMEYASPDYGPDVERRLTDPGLQVESMDEAAVALAVVAVTSPGIEGIFDTGQAIDAARRTNDEIRARYTAGEHASRFRAFGCVPMQDPQAAAEEAARCVRELGCVGILINGHTDLGDANTVQYLDEPQCEPFWARLEELDVPLYIHPRVPAPGQKRIYRDFESLSGSPWGFAAETSLHAVRLMMSGLFDRHPRLKIVLGHCGEGLPFFIERTDHRLRHYKRDERHVAAQPLRAYLENNFWVTTAGIMSTRTLHDTLTIFGTDRVMWSCDYPYESYQETGTWFDHLQMDDRTRAKLGWENAEQLLGL